MFKKSERVKADQEIKGIQGINLDHLGRYLDDNTQDSIAHDLGCHQSWVSLLTNPLSDAAFKVEEIPVLFRKFGWEYINDLMRCIGFFAFPEPRVTEIELDFGKAQEIVAVMGEVLKEIGDALRDGKIISDEAQRITETTNRLICLAFQVQLAAQRAAKRRTA